MTHTLRHYGRILQKIFTFLKGQQKMGMIKQLLKQPDNAGKLEMSKQELHKAVEMFRVCPVVFNFKGLSSHY
jgi:hypothetical protein